MKYKIENDEFEIVHYVGPDGSEGYVIVKNGEEIESTETESGACYLILNEYKVKE